MKEKKKKAVRGRPRAPMAMHPIALRRAREDAGISLRELAKALKISAPSLHALEAGDANISARRAAAIIKVFVRRQKTPPALIGGAA